MTRSTAIRTTSLVALAATLALSAQSADAGNRHRTGITLPGIGNISTPKIDLGQITRGITLPRPPVTLPTPPVTFPKPPVVCPPRQPLVHPPVHPPLVPPPVVWPPPTPIPTVNPVPTVNPIGFVNPAPRQWYFGMSLQRTSTPYGTGLQVFSVTPGSPAQQAGLEPGDVLLVSNSVRFAAAQTNEHGVQMLQSSVDAFRPMATLTVIDVRTQQVTHVYCGPQRMNAPVPTGGLPVPANAGPAPGFGGPSVGAPPVGAPAPAAASPTF